MRNLQLDSILLFALVIPFIMTYPLGVSGTPYILFGFVFLGLFLYLLLDLIKLSEAFYFRFKQIILWALIVMVLGSAFVSAIIVRHQIHPIYRIHDIVIQQELAIRLLLHGKNPYAQTYFGTPLEQWHYSETEVNPALYHFVMEPFYLIFAIPFYVASTRTIGYFDGRIPLVFLFLVLLILGSRLVKDNRQRLLFLILLAFNPAMAGYTLEGRSDVFMLAFLFAGLYLLQRGRYAWAGVPTALAFAIKQSAWPVLPFYAAFLYFKTKNMEQTIKMLMPFVLTFAIVVLPFFLWNQKAFIDSTILYLSGNAPHSYPIAGYGWGMILSRLGFIKDVDQYYPFHIWQAIIGIPVLIVLLRFLKNAPAVSRLIVAYGIFLFVFWYFSRYFNNSHLGYLSMIFITAYFWPQDKNKE